MSTIGAAKERTMIRNALRKHARLLIPSSLVLVLLAGGVAFAVGTIPGEDGVIHGCFDRASGILRVIDPTTASCRNKESALFWNQEGEPGQDGTNGTNGLDGTNGVDGTNGTNGIDGTNGVDGKTVLNGTEAPDESIGTLGDFYLDTSTSTLYGPLTEAGWGEGTSLVGPAGADGTDGTDGTDGAPGATGATGSPGISAYQVVHASSPPSLDGKTVHALCPSGTIPIGGGGRISGFNRDVTIITSAPTTAHGLYKEESGEFTAMVKAWTVAAINTSAPRTEHATWTLHAYAVCANVAT